LVEDDQAVRESMKLLLEIDRHAVTEAGNGHDAMRLFAGSSYDLVIMDYLMPEMLGDELALHLKAMTPTQPILMVTGHPEDFADGGCHVDAVLAKPFTIKDLRQAIPGPTQSNTPSARAKSNFGDAFPDSDLEDPSPSIGIGVEITPRDARDHVDSGTLVLWVQEAAGSLDGPSLSSQPDSSTTGMMELLTFAYACNVLASDEVRADCEMNPAFRFLCHGSPPFASEITIFRRRNRPQLESALARTLAGVMAHGQKHSLPATRPSLLGAARQRLDIARHLDTWG
jgi:CheY-like chemotaxis protein